MAVWSNRGVVVTDCDDFEDNRILEGALACGAVMIVSDHDELLRLWPWRGCVIVTAAEFVVNQLDCEKVADV